MAMYLISSHKKGISTHQLARDIEVTQKTAWFILHKVRTLFAQYDTPALDGEIEMDEMYLGGRETNKHQSKKTEGTQGKSLKTKSAIFGMVERGGIARCIHVTDTKSATLMPIIKQFCKENSHLFTDESMSYAALTKNGYTHSVIQHGIKEYSKGGVTTNSIEGFWGHFKRMVFGTYHFVGKSYIQRYLDEAVYRYNMRNMPQSQVFADMMGKSIGVVSYADVKISIKQVA